MPLAARVKHAAFQIRASDSRPVEQTIDDGAERGTQGFRQLFGQHDMQPVVAQIETQQVQAVREQMGLGVEHGNPRDRSAPVSSTAAAPSPKRAVDTSCAVLASLRWKLRVGNSTATMRTWARVPGQKIVCPGQRSRACHATKLGDGQAAHVRPKAQVLGQVGIQRRDHEAVQRA